AHPRAIRTTLVPRDGGYVLSGRKKWATIATEAQSLYVVASTGIVEDQNRLRVVRVAASAPGVRLHASAAAFVPEISHPQPELVAEIERAWPEGDERTRWQRDRGLLQVAGKARAARRDRAWQR